MRPQGIRTIDGDRTNEDLLRDRRQRRDTHTSTCRVDPSLRLAERARCGREDDVRAEHRLCHLSGRLLAVPRQRRERQQRHCSRPRLRRCRERLRNHPLLVVVDDEHVIGKSDTQAAHRRFG